MKLGLKVIDPTKLRAFPLKKIEFKMLIILEDDSNSLPTHRLANESTRFHTENYPDGYIFYYSSGFLRKENYIPIGFEKSGVVCSDKLRLLDKATNCQFGILVKKNAHELGESSNWKIKI